jgi:uncharacterized membrane protein YfcA
MLATLGGMGLIVGFLSGLLGVGGGIFMVSALVLLAPLLLGVEVVTPLAATGIAALQGLASTVAASLLHVQAKRLCWRQALTFGAPTAVASYASAVASAHWPKLHILGLMALLLLAAITLALRKVWQQQRHAGSSAATPEATGTPALALSLPQRGVSLAYSLGVGWLSGVLGIGGAVLLVPFFTEYLKLSVKQAVILTTGTAIFTSLGTLGGKVQMHLVPWQLALFVAVLAFAGGWWGAHMQQRFSATQLRLFHVGLLLLALAETLRKMVGLIAFAP